MNVLQQIFTDYYEEIEYTLHPRKTEMENIDKMIHCGDPSFGGAMYGCPSSSGMEVKTIERVDRPEWLDSLPYLRQQICHGTHYQYVL